MVEDFRYLLSDEGLHWVLRAQIVFLRWPNVGSTLYTTMAD